LVSQITFRSNTVTRTYDDLGQVVSGKKYWSDGTPVAGQQFEYGFDDIGNRKNTKVGGDETGANLRPANYMNNTLNQIISRGVPGYVEVLIALKNLRRDFWRGEPPATVSVYLGQREFGLVGQAGSA
ncbi:MAG: hypothetical protein Q8N51_10760, partial [Gammaproteobacteria bacterium]|nr:hypothetical protein [Gammaproteobacteria bacterium]